MNASCRRSGKMAKFKAFLKKKNIEISLKRYGIDALGAMAQGLFCSLLIGTIIDTLGKQLNIGFLTQTVATISGKDYTVGGMASAMSGPAMAVAIGHALQCPPLVLFSMITVGFAANALGGAGGPLAVLFIAIIAAEFGKLVSKETKVDILVTPLVTIGVGMFLSWLIAPPLGKAAMAVGNLIMWATELQPFLMGILVSVLVGVALTLPISSATCLFRLEMNGPPVSSGMGTCGLVGPLGVYTGWVNDVAAGTKAAITGMDWLGLVLICLVLPAILSLLIHALVRKAGWVKDGDLKLGA